MIVFIAFATGFYLGVFLMSLLGIGKKRKVPKEMVSDVASAA
ncbi:MAG: hypothetical protein AB7Y74_14770 [Syntrophorhabdus sp.]|jgi:hypothetical protein